MQALTIFLFCILCLAHTAFAEEEVLCGADAKVDPAFCQKYPRIYKEVVRNIDGKNRTIRIQDATPEYFAQIVEYYKSDYSSDEPLAYYSGCFNSTACLEETGGDMMYFLGTKLSVVALMKDDNDKDVVVGYDILGASNEGEEPNPQDPNLKKILNLLGFVSEMRNIFQTFHVKTYLSSMGYNVIKKYRGMNLGQDIVSVGPAVAQCNKIKVTLSSFTSAVSQRQAKSAGFIDFVEVEYDKFTGSPIQMGEISNASKSVKFMYKCS